MATPRNKTVSTLYPGHHNFRSFYRRQVGWNGDKKTVYTYEGDTCFSRGHYLVNGNVSPMDAANAWSANEFRSYSGIPPWAQLGYNQAYARLREKVMTAEAALGAFLAEVGEAARMILQRVLSLIRSFKAAKKGHWKRAFSELSGVTDSRQWTRRRAARNAAKTAADWWLELWFGWLPSLGDIYNAAEVMCSEMGLGSQYGTATSRQNISVIQPGGATRTTIASIRHKVGGVFAVSNPNKLLLNQLGLANPIGTLWEIIPFSFMLDWVFKIGDYINSYNDWYGLTITKSFHTHVMRYQNTETLKLPLPSHITGGPKYGFGIMMVRGVGIPKPLPARQFNGNLDTLLTRTASAVSILVNLMVGAPRAART